MHPSEDTWIERWWWLIRTFLSCAMILFITLGVFTRVRVDGHSMDPTLYHGQKLTAMRAWNPLIRIQNADIVTAKTEEIVVVKRVMACPGDTIEIRDNLVYRNGLPLEEPYIFEPMNTEDMPPITMGEDEYFLLGDNRNISKDSRMVGAFKKDDIESVLYLEQQGLLATIHISLIVVMVILTVLPLFKRTKEDAVLDQLA